MSIYHGPLMVIVVKELVYTTNGAFRWRDPETKKWVDRPKGISIDKESMRQNLQETYLEPSDSGGGRTKTGLFDQTISISSLRALYERDELLFNSVETLGRDVFAKGFELTAFKRTGEIHQGATEQAKRIMAKVNFLGNLRLAFRSRIVHGVAVLLMVYPGNIEEPVERHQLRDMKVIPWENLVDWQIDLRPTSDNYGTVVGVKMDRVIGGADGTGETTKQVVMHEGRFIHWPMPTLDGSDPWGLSKLFPLHDILTVKKNIDWSLGEALFQFVAGKLVVIVPGSTPDKVFNQLKLDLQEFDVTTSFLARGEGLEIINMRQGQAGMDPEPYTNYFMALASIGLGVPYPMLFRGLGGGASDLIQRNYASNVGDIQRTEIEPVIRHFLNMLDIGEVDRWQIEWKPFMELTEEEMSFIMSRKGLAWSLEARAVDKYIANGASVEFDVTGHIKRVFVGTKDGLVLKPPEKPEPIPGLPTVPPGIPKILPTAPQKPGEEPPELPQAEKDELRKLIAEVAGDLYKNIAGDGE